MKLAKGLIRIGRALGIIHIVVFTGAMIYIGTMIYPWIEGSDGALVIAAGCFLLAAIFSIFLLIAWRREILGGVFYLIFPVSITLLILIYPSEEAWRLLLSLAPTYLTGVLFLTGGILKRQNGRTGLLPNPQSNL